jgi:MbtH protein
MANELVGSEVIFDVVVNDEEQYSVWPAAKTIPLGWHREGFSGTKDECMNYIDRVWTDMRPRSLRA